MRRERGRSSSPTAQPRHYYGSQEKLPRPVSPTVSVIIPTLNEAGNLPYVLNTVPSWVTEIIIVDGRSLDDTERVAKTLRPDLRIVQQVLHGKGAALRAG